MKHRVSLIAVVALVAGVYAVAAQNAGTSEAERYIIESERQWAESVANGDATGIERILANDFVGVDPDGSFYNKAKMVADTREAPKYFPITQRGATGSLFVRNARSVVKKSV